MRCVRELDEVVRKGTMEEEKEEKARNASLKTKNTQNCEEETHTVMSCVLM